MKGFLFARKSSIGNLLTFEKNEIYGKIIIEREKKKHPVQECRKASLFYTALYKKYYFQGEPRRNKARGILPMSKNKNNSNKNKQNWFDNNPFFDNKEGYENFAKAMIAAAEEGHIPIILKHEKPEPMTSTDIKLFAQRFKRDTGLSVEFKFSICNHCDRLHCFLIIDQFPESETESDNE